MALDARGHEISVGDTVIYLKTGRYPERVLAVVKEVGPAVLIEAIDRIGLRYGREDKQTARVKGPSLIVMRDLPGVGTGAGEPLTAGTGSDRASDDG